MTNKMLSVIFWIVTPFILVDGYHMFGGTNKWCHNPEDDDQYHLLAC
jgi:hypothetical protein